MNRHAACLQQRDTPAVVVHTHHLIPQFSQTGCGNQPHVSSAYHGDFHVCLSLNAVGRMLHSANDGLMAAR
jgi:hypothetical protein